eukprot:scaffold162021_cov29-Cyclotella_meneghiniana.AAC.1
MPRVRSDRVYPTTYPISLLHDVEIPEYLPEHGVGQRGTYPRSQISRVANPAWDPRAIPGGVEANIFLGRLVGLSDWDQGLLPEIYPTPDTRLARYLPDLIVESSGIPDYLPDLSGTGLKIPEYLPVYSLKTPVS